MKRTLIALGAVEVFIGAVIRMRLKGFLEAVAGELDLLADLRQVRDAEWCAVFFDQLDQRQIVPSQVRRSKIRVEGVGKVPEF